MGICVLPRRHKIMMSTDVNRQPRSNLIQERWGEGPSPHDSRRRRRCCSIPREEELLQHRFLAAGIMKSKSPSICTWPSQESVESLHSWCNFQKASLHRIDFPVSFYAVIFRAASTPSHHFNSKISQNQWHSNFPASTKCHHSLAHSLICL
jgi:hypothetical protein